MRAILVGTIVVALVALSVAVLPACEDVPQPVLCRDIPAGGCPLNANACEDPTCNAVYACEVDGTWTLDRTCPKREAGPGGADAASDAPTDADAGPGNVPRDAGYADVEGANGGPGCIDLEPPDCPLGTAAACPANQCCSCEDLFVCRDGGWDSWGSCDPASGVISPR